MNVPIADVVPYTIADMQILLKKDAPAEGEEGEGKDHYAVLSITLSMNSKHKDYKTYGEEMATREDLIRGQIIEVVQQYWRKRRAILKRYRAISLREYRSFLIQISSLL